MPPAVVLARQREAGFALSPGLFHHSGALKSAGHRVTEDASRRAAARGRVPPVGSPVLPHFENFSPFVLVGWRESVAYAPSAPRYALG
ncbi:hypothetical protein GDO81_020068 [Engystomops pustulosus]|uniref:Uncharacterized protein n=1 Tax=Engystomops pustulosus TaxID=76066 RepID=A0AAV6YVV9_ENGPU|nr:hypothetical protein GDO81_020068 [Engystomops pustulosus]